MMSPLKLSVIVCGAAAGLAVAPYVVKQILPPVDAGAVASGAPTSSENLAVKLDLPIAGTNGVTDTPPVLALAPPAKQELPARPELHLVAPALPVPAPVRVTALPVSGAELALPSLARPEIASVMPSPAKTPAPTPSPTPEIPYRAEVETAQKLMRDLGLNTGKIDGKLGPNTQTAVRNFQIKEGMGASGDVTPELLKKMEKAVAALPAPTPVPTPVPEIVITDASKKDELPVVAETAVKNADNPDAVVVRKSEKAKADAAFEVKSKVVAAAGPKVDPGPVPNLNSMTNVKKLQTQLKAAGTYDGNVDGKWGDLTRAAMRGFQEKAGIEITGRPNKETWLAMHSGVVVPAESEVVIPAETIAKSKTATADSSIASAGAMKISSMDSAIAEPAPAEETVVSVNGDGVSTPEGAAPIATPATVSDFSKKSDAPDPSGEVSSSIPDKDTPKVKVSAPKRSPDNRDEDSADADEPNDMAVAEVDRDGQLEKLQKDIEDKRAKVNSVSNDSTYEVKKYAPKMLETVNNMVDNLKIESVSNNPAEARVSLAKIDEELEKAKNESMKKKAGELVAAVREAYEELKQDFPERIKSLSLKDKVEKTRREELTELVAKCDVGFDAMTKDFEKGKYGPIFDNGVNFRATINDISTDVAEVYVGKKLEQKDVKKKLKADDIKKIKDLRSDENHVKAAEIIDSRISSGTGKKS